MQQKNLANQFEIEDIFDDMVSFFDDSYAIVLETTSVNLDLKSEAESDVLIAHYQHLLQSLTTPIQILIQTRAVDMDAYDEALCGRIDSASTSTKHGLLQDYRDFLSQLVVGRNMLTRRFYIVLRTSPKQSYEQAREQLHTRKELLVRLLQPLELKAAQLSSLQLANLLYASFQPGKSKIQPLSEEVLL